jgi:DNA-binding transcriptional regulator YhcF (GntR family)
MREAAPELDLRVDRAAEVPLGTQLAWKLRALVTSGALSPGDRLPSVRELALDAGVNVNTVRAVYGRLETEGLIRSEQGRGTFVSAPSSAPAPGEERAARHELRRQIAALEAELVRVQPSPAAGEVPRASGGRLPTTDELRAIRDQLFTRLRQLDDERADLMRRLAELDRSHETEPAPEPEPPPARRSSVSLRGARVRWVG